MAATRPWRSDLPDGEVGGTTIPALALRHAARLSDTPALVDAGSGRTLGDHQLDAGIERLDAGQVARGFAWKH